MFIAHAFLSLVFSLLFLGAELLAIVDFLNYLYGFLIFACTATMVRDFRDIHSCFRFWIYGGLIVSAVAVWGIVGGAPEWVYDGRRISSTLRAVNQMQSYLGPVLLISCIYFFYNGISRSFKTVLVMGILMNIVAQLSTGSRSAVIFLAIIFCTTIYVSVKNLRGSPVLSSTILGSSVLLFLGFAYITIGVLDYGPTFLPEGSLRAIARPILLFRDMIAMDNAIEAMGPRGQQIELVLHNWYEFPVLGVGPGNFELYFDHRHEVHNTYLGVLIEHGLLGLVLLLGFIAGVLLSTGRSKIYTKEKNVHLLRITLVSLTLLLLLYGAMAFGLRQRVFWLTLGICVAFVHINSRNNGFEYSIVGGASRGPKG